MLDPILKGYTREFLEQYELQSTNEADDFERFANFCVFLPYQNPSSPLDIDSVHTGQTGDTGLDGLGILINGVLVNSEDEIDFEISNGRDIEVKFIFLQAKSSNSFDVSVFFTLRDAIVDIFSDYLEKESSFDRRSKLIEKKAKLINYLLNKGSKQIRERPRCNIYYITSSRKSADSSVTKKIKRLANEISEKLSFLDSISFDLWGCSEIEKLYRRNNLQVRVEVNLEKAIEISPNSIEGVDKAITGMIKLYEFKKIIADDEGNLRNFIFYDNVRGFLGEDNQVNKDILKTIRSENPSKFSILNNGITILCKELRQKSMTRFDVIDYQIVNGCQTSHVLYKERNSSSAQDILIPIKFIETDNDDVRNDIINATNNQSEVKKELLLALSDFPKRLESYYRTVQQHNESSLFYERRPGQYHSDKNIVKKRVVGIINQIKSFAAMFLDEPHNIRYKNELIKGIGKTIFADKHDPFPYYVSALTLYTLERFLNTKSHNEFSTIEYKAELKYHIIMVFKYLVTNHETCPKCSNTKDIISYCESITRILKKQDKAKEYFLRSYKIIRDVAQKEGMQDTKEAYRDNTKKKRFTDQILMHIDAENKNLSKNRQDDIRKKQGEIPFDV